MIPNFTPEETTYIKQTFTDERIRTHFIDKPKKITNLDDIREVLDYRDKRIGYIGVKGHRLMHAIYAKLGYCKDGKTLIVDAQRRIKEIEVKEQNQLMVLRTEALEKVNAQIKVLQSVAKELEAENKSYQDLKKEVKRSLSGAFDRRVDMETKKRIKEEVSNFSVKIDELNVSELRRLAKQKKLTGYSKMRKAELINLVREE